MPAASPILCPRCGAAATLPLPGLADKVGAVFGLAFSRRGTDLSFQNPEMAQKFAAGEISALCTACGRRFHQQDRQQGQPTAQPASAARPAVERLKELEALRAAGLISAAEYQAKRAEILRAL